MNPINIETISNRIERIRHSINTMPKGFKLSINHEFELACLNELLNRMENDAVNKDT